MAESGDACRVESAHTERTVAIGHAIGSCCVAGDVVALEGELGAGKTQLVRGLAAGLGLDPRQVSSPTFVIVQEYVHKADDGIDDFIEALIHIDAYRLRSAEDLASIGWEGGGSAMREGAVVAIEWASLLGAALPADRLTVHLEHEPTGRSLTLSAHGVWRARMPKVRAAIDAVSPG